MTNDRPGKGGPDSSVSKRPDDRLGRWTLAETIYRLIRECPTDWSPRIGLYAKWGEGKTTVLNFVEAIAHRDGVPVLWFSPWKEQNRNDLWSAFSLELERKLGYRPSKWQRVRRAAGRWGLKVRSWLSPARAAVAASAPGLPTVGLPPGSEEIAKGLLTLAESLLSSATTAASPAREDVERQLLVRPAPARLIVFIDDVDRGEAELMPHLLLALREVFDLPGCVFIVAFDPDTLAAAFPAAHAGWKATPEFLEKIIQFSFWLPAPSREQIRALAQDETTNIPSVDPAALNEIADLLSPNPRRLKDFFRGLWRLNATLRRHDSSEIEWMPLLIVELMRALTPTGTQQLFRSSLLREKLAVSGFFRGDSKDKHGQEVFEDAKSEAARILASLKCPQDVQDELFKLLEAFRDRVGVISEESLRYWAQLEERPPIFTWKEFNSLVAQWNGSCGHLSDLVERHVRVIGCTADDAYRELFETALNYRGKALAAAADDILVDADMAAEMDKADVGLSLARTIVGEIKGFSKKPSILTAGHFRLLLDQFRHWAHFQNHPRYVAAREAERELLLKAASEASSFAPEVLDMLSPWSGLFEHGEPAQIALRGAVIKALATHVFDDVESRFARKEGIASLWGKDRHLVEKYLLFRRDSGFYSADRVLRLLALAQQAKSSAAIQENFHEYLRLLVYGFTHILNPLTPEEMTPLASDVDIMSASWRAATARPLQPRMVMAARKIRTILAQKLGSDASLPLPSWLPPVPDPSEQQGMPDAEDAAGGNAAPPEDGGGAAQVGE